MSILTDKLDTLGALSFWDKKGIRYYPKGNFEYECDEILKSNGYKSSWYFDGETGGLEFSWLRNYKTGNESENINEAKELLKTIIKEWATK